MCLRCHNDLTQKVNHVKTHGEPSLLRIAATMGGYVCQGRVARFKRARVYLVTFGLAREWQPALGVWPGELPDASAQLPAGALSMDTLQAGLDVHVRHHFDSYPAWASAMQASGDYPTETSGVLGLATASSDRGQRTDRRIPAEVAR